MSELLVNDMATRVVPGEPPKKRKRPDPRVTTILTAIDLARQEKGYSSLTDMLKEAEVAESTWHSWRTGETTPDYVKLDDVAKVAGLSVGMVLDPSRQEELEQFLRGGRHMPSELAQTIALLADRLDTDKEKLELLSKVRAFVQEKVSGSRPPRGGDGK